MEEESQAVELEERVRHTERWRRSITNSDMLAPQMETVQQMNHEAFSSDQLNAFLNFSMLEAARPAHVCSGMTTQQIQRGRETETERYKTRGRGEGRRGRRRGQERRDED